MVKSLTNFVG